MENILFRASGISHIMTDSRSKSEILSEGCKTHLIDIFVARNYGRDKEIHTRYTDKGLQVEDDAITLYSRCKKKFFKKNTEWLYNNYVCGTPDIYEGEEIKKATRVIDIKSSFDIYTFFRSKYKPINNDYWYQLQVYMALTGAKTSTLVYCLIDTPPSIIEAEKRKLLWSMGVTDTDQDFIDGCSEIDRLHTYPDIPMQERCFEIEVERDEKEIEKIYKRVEQCREYMKEKFNYPLELCLTK